ncbi:MAG: hypothetical protein JW957_05060 [Candidatus Omnitrophica bacterium]|nr:hypothetical protein [Candidatus Omnitrophota bacterium]
MNNLSSRGSEWQKWDLHIHSPASFGYIGTYDELIKTLTASDAKVLGINDYCTFEGYEEILKRGGIKNRFLFPVIELRMHNIVANRKGTPIQKGAKINFHLIFNNNPDFFKRAKIWLSSLSCYNAQGNNDQLGNIPKPDIEKITVDFFGIVESLKTFGLRNEVLIWLPYDEYGGIDDIDPNDNFFKLGLIKKSDIIGSSTEKQIEFFLWRDNKFNEEDYKNWFEKPLPCMKGSDSHEATYPVGKLKDKKSNPAEKYCWIKADPTFEGLKQLQNEPHDRVFIGLKPPKLLEVEGNRSKYIDSIKVNSIKGKNGSWFDNELPLNNGLIAVIGRKGSGKSAFTDIVSRCGNSKIDPNDYSFLNKSKFRKRGLAENYEATLKWLNGQANEKANLNTEVNTAIEVEKVKYLPQKFVERICDETGVSTLFQREIEKVIFAYVPDESRLGALTLSELIKIKTQSVEEKITCLHSELNAINRKMVMMEKKKRKDYLAGLTNKLDEKRRELNALTEPKEVKKPKSTLSESDQAKLDKITKELEDIEKKISEAKTFLKDVNNKISKLGNIKSVVSQLQDKHSEVLKKVKTDADLLSIDLSELIKLTINDTMLTQKEDELLKEKKRLDYLLEQDDNSSKISFYNKKAKLKTEKEEITKAFTAEQKVYDDYIEKVCQFKARQKEIEGAEDDASLETIKSIEKEIKYIKSNLAKELETEKNERIKALKNLHQELIKKIDFYKEVYSPVIKFIKQEKKTQEKSGSMLSFDVGTTFDKQSFASDFFTFLNRNRDGSFQNIVNGQNILDGIIAKYDFKTDTAIINFINDLIEHLNFDKTKTPATENDLRSQIRGSDEENIKLYDFLFGLGYLDVKFKVLFNNKDLNSNELSPGEKGALLLIFYLLIDRDNIPLIIDQPEENLDNESVYSLLVPYMKQAKQKRQIIAVTHNPNLAVVCDAEQVIYAQMDKKLNQVRYSAGSIENPATNKRVVDVLEGTMPAFEIRDTKYIRKS